MRKLTILALGVFGVVAITNRVHAQNPCTQDDEKKYTNAESAYRQYLAAGTIRMSYSDYWEAAISQLSQPCRGAIWQLLILNAPHNSPGSDCTKDQLNAMIVENGRKNYQGPLADCRKFHR